MSRRYIRCFVSMLLVMAMLVTGVNTRALTPDGGTSHVQTKSGRTVCTLRAAGGKAASGSSTTVVEPKDKKPPVITGILKKKSLCMGDAYLTCYSDQRENFKFKRFVSVRDNHDKHVKLRVNTDEVNWKKTGLYKVRFIATDKAGNRARSWSYLQVYVPGEMEKTADRILSSIIRPSWSDTKKARAIYSHLRNILSYVGDNGHEDWRKVAAIGMAIGTGDCFTYYSVSRALLTRAGIPNLTIERYPAHEGYHHWWNIVYVQKGWYHFDTVQRRRGGVFCLVTNKQLMEYNAGGTTFAYRSGVYPEWATKEISPTPRHDRE